MSPTPGRSTLMTSAPMNASNWVQVGPDCTWVKSRMRTPSSALPASPHGLVEGFGKPARAPAADLPPECGAALLGFDLTFVLVLASCLTAFFADFLTHFLSDFLADFLAAAFAGFRLAF